MATQAASEPHRAPLSAPSGPAAELRPRILFVGAFVARSAGSRAASLLIADELEERGWSTLRTSDSHSRVARLLDMLRTVVSQRERYDIAHVDLFSGKAFVWAEVVCAALRWLGRPYVLTLRGGGLPDFSARNPSRVKRLLGSAEALTAPSQFLVDAMTPFSDRIELIPNALVVDRYRYRVRERLQPRIVWVRTFHELYRPAQAVEALAALLRKHPDATLTMVGPDKGDGSFQRTRRRAVELGVAERVEFTGGVAKAKIPELLDRHDIFLNTTSVDNTPVSMLEAMVSGLCVVSTDVGGIPYIARHRSNAMLTPCGSLADMVDCIGELLEDPALAGRISRNGKSRAEEFDWIRVLPSWTELFCGAMRSQRESYVLDSHT
jgi:glycosyltransferase involved in cell wall biosynthesis